MKRMNQKCFILSLNVFKKWLNVFKTWRSTCLKHVQLTRNFAVPLNNPAVSQLRLWA